jgi:hypothetical protein
MKYLKIFIFTLSISMICVSANAENFTKEKYVKISKYDLKSYLENDQILEIFQTNEDGIIGKYRGGDGNTHDFIVQLWGNSNPFIADAIKKRGLSFEHKPFKRVHETYTTYYGFTPYVLIVLLIINIYIAIKVRRTYQLTANNNKENITNK